MCYDDIRAALSAAGIDVREPGEKNGICTAPYAVVQDMGTYPYAAFERLGYSLMTVHCYVPLVCYDGLALLVDRVRAALSGMEPDLRPTGRLGVHTINDQFRAHETFVEYLVQKRL